MLNRPHTATVSALRFVMSVFCLLVLFVTVIVGTASRAEAEEPASPTGNAGPSALIYLPLIQGEQRRVFEDMIVIPAGLFEMGCDPASGKCEINEGPLRTVNVGHFSIDKFEVTNARYAACVAAGGCTAPNSSLSSGPEFPVGFVTQKQAAAYCLWDEKRLPTEAEWEKAARGLDGRTYPWGEEAPTCDLANFQSLVTGFSCEFPGSPVGTYPDGASHFGVMDMAGNVAEWTSTTEPLLGGTGNIMKGGSFASFPNDLRTSARLNAGEGFLAQHIGFRCVLP